MHRMGRVLCPIANMGRVLCPIATQLWLIWDLGTMGCGSTGRTCRRNQTWPYECATGLECQHKAGARPQGKLRVDVGFWAGLVPANARDPAALRALLDGGALGFKAFLCPSGAAL